MNQKHQKLYELLERTQRFDKESLFRAFAHHVEYRIGKYKDNINMRDVYQSVAYTIRDTLIDRWNETEEIFRKEKAKRIYYLSMEFLLGRLLETSMVNLGAREMFREMLKEIDYDPEELPPQEHDAGLGNGGLGRLAACFLDSMATMDLPTFGSGLRYEYGIFHQEIENGYQKEAPDNWLQYGNPWEIQRQDLTYLIKFYGHTEEYVTPTGKSLMKWVHGESLLAQAYDMLIPGFQTRTIANLRLWRTRASSEFHFDYFNHGDYMRAVEDKQRSENVSKVLYPNENVIQGRELRLKQEYVLVSATLQDAIKTFLEEETDFNRIPERAFFQMNDTHPALAVPELMRLLMDEHAISWEQAWAITQKCTAYTNHTVMPEALEKWDLEMFGRLLPRHLEIIYEINHRFLEDLKKRGIPDDVLGKVSIIEDHPMKRVRMANLAIVGSSAVNGVAALHTDLLKKDLFKEFYSFWPQKFQNKTNGITHRRWLISANQELSDLITAKIGKDWMLDLSKMKALEEFAGNPEFQNDWNRVRKNNKIRLAGIIKKECGITVNPDSMFDTHIKRMHEYKRQLLNLIRVIGDYQKLKANPRMEYTPRVVLFAGKAAPGYQRAKLIIKLIHSVAGVINKDREIGDKLKVAFLPNFCVSLAERMYPASDLSEQISTAGTEASGTGNMKFMLNGALTVGTLDGANVEMKEEAGDENIYIFGHTVEEIEKLSRSYNPVRIYEENSEIHGILNALKGDFFNPEAHGLFQELFHSLTYGGDKYFLLADYPSYVDVQNRISRDFVDRPGWTKKSILNAARSGKFSSDRTIGEYANEIWHAKPIRQRSPRLQAVLDEHA
ncbi:MAG: glycogen/starch/alpha-glucan phosphorylase [Leptospirales bacterium]|nr:glycogen/starch/alpha-glucan phosphorylase [Leptospirales bacterium]HNJ34075.1 glycogen/starch/alpha-glucan phosphorylase [Leptospiraceae bacterium]HNN58119.1 glycogen/starch/alpha-glucan phosphorylase [Leptospiraceae bacterium]HNN74241.1 glycogen/starch/alpha-glucan phosphorylase [Leptospiraceae bacterium]